MTVREAPGPARLRADEGVRRNGTVARDIIGQALALPTEGPLASLDEACRLLAGCRDLDEVRAIRDMAEAARLYARAIDRGLEAQNHAAEIKLRAERRAGELLAGLPREVGGRPRENSYQPETSLQGTIRDAEISVAQANRWQAAAAVPLPVFEKLIAETVGAGRELTSASVLKIARPIINPRAIRHDSKPATFARPSRATILVGDVRAGLAGLPRSSVHVAISSPPYYGLRSYGSPDQVWGGEPDHAHEWGDIGRAFHPGQVPQTKWANISAVADGGRAGSGSSCPCGAWLGHLGLEPSPD